MMKRICILIIACLVTFTLNAQEHEPEESKASEAPRLEELPQIPQPPEGPTTPETPESTWKGDTVRILDKAEVIETPGNTKVTLGQDEVVIIEENGDTVRVKLGSRGISIVEGKKGTEIKIMDMDEEQTEEEYVEDESSSSTRDRKKKKFKAHFAGFEIGLNNYLTPGFNMKLPQDQIFMDLNTGRSWNFNLNILEYGLGLGTDKVGVVTGLGFEWTNYVFDYQNSITKDENGVIVEYIPLAADNIVKSKFNMTYLTAPLLLEFQIPAGKKRIHLSGGMIGGVKIASNTKIKYEISGQKSKEKSKGDFNLAPLRYGVTVRLGYRALNLYANYYLMSLFGENGGPELYPFSIGLVLIPF